MNSILFTPASLGPLRLRNRSIRAAAFEGMCPGHLVSDELIRYHTAVAAGGIGMSTVAYASVTRDGLSFPHQLLISPEAIPGLRRLTDAVHREGAAAGLQIGHCGLMAKRSVAGDCIAPSGRPNLYGPTWPRRMTGDDISRVISGFGQAVLLAREAGFDAVEVHAGHGYLVSQFLSPYTNKRKDAYGGSLANRSRFMEAVINRVMEAAGADLAVVVKMNMYDGFPGGMELPESLEVARKLERLGVHGLVLSGGFVSKAPMHVMRGRIPVRVMARYMENPFMRVATALFGGFLIREVPFRDLYFLDDARQFLKTVRLPLIYVGGIKSRGSIEKVLSEGFSFVQIARALVHDPGFIGKLVTREVETSGCDTANYCIARIYSGSMVCHQHNPGGG